MDLVSAGAVGVLLLVHAAAATAHALSAARPSAHRRTLSLQLLMVASPTRVQWMTR